MDDSGIEEVDIAWLGTTVDRIGDEVIKDWMKEGILDEVDCVVGKGVGENVPYVTLGWKWKWIGFSGRVGRDRLITSNSCKRSSNTNSLPIINKYISYSFYVLPVS